MRKAMLLAVMAILLLTFGCLGDKQLNLDRKEQVILNENFEITGDSLDEFSFYVFSPRDITEANVKIQKYVFVSTQKTALLEDGKNLSVEKINEIEIKFEEFVREKQDISNKCKQKLGIVGVRCLDAKSCTKLCTENSQECKDIVKKYETTFGRYILQYVKDDSEMENEINDVLNNIPKLKGGSDSKKQEIIESIINIENKISSINSNPIFRPEIFGLCQQTDYSIENAISAANEIGKYSVAVEEYNYRTFIKLNEGTQEEKLVYKDIVLKETLPADVGTSVQIISPQQIEVKTEAGRETIQWPVFKPYSKNTDMYAYEFVTTISPDQIIPKLEVPKLTLKTLDLRAITPTMWAFNIIYSTIGNYYIAFGASLAITIILIYIIYTVINLLYNVISVKLAGMHISHGIKRAIGKPNIKWKTDAIFGGILLVIGIAISFFYAPSSTLTQFDVFGLMDSISNDGLIFVAAFFTFVGILFLYNALDNYARMSILEKAYGKKLKDEKELFSNKVSRLKQKIAELKELVTKLGDENFEVGSEYELISKISTQHIENLEKKDDFNSRKIIDDYLTQIEEAIEGLQEKKKNADENWGKWSETITNLIEENEEVYVSNLVTVPSSLRGWALNKYAREHPEKGLIYEGNVIKKKAVTAEKATKNLFDKNLLLGVIVIKNGKLIMSQMGSESGTVSGVLALKLLNYLRSLSTKLHMHNYDSLAVVGEKSVMALIKYREVESVIFTQKDKFKEAIDDWKNKIKNV